MMLEYTKEELDNLLKDRLNELLSFVGGYVHLAKMLGLSPSTAQGWVKRGRISKRGAVKVSTNGRLKYKFTVRHLRPDL